MQIKKIQKNPEIIYSGNVTNVTLKWFFLWAACEFSNKHVHYAYDKNGMSKRTNDELASSKISKIPLHRRNSTNRCKSFDQQNLISPPLCSKTNEIIGKRMLTRLNDLESEIILVIKF